MNEQMTALIEKLAAKLGVTAEYLWAVLVRQALIDGAISVAVSVVIVTAAAFAWRKALSLDKDDYNKEPAIMVLFFISVFAFVFVSLLLGSAITAFANPEYWALKQIIK